jgi:hypothetical protein
MDVTRAREPRLAIGGESDHSHSHSSHSSHCIFHCRFLPCRPLPLPSTCIEPMPLVYWRLSASTSSSFHSRNCSGLLLGMGVVLVAPSSNKFPARTNQPDKTFLFLSCLAPFSRPQPRLDGHSVIVFLPISPCQMPVSHLPCPQQQKWRSLGNSSTEF